MKVRRAPLVLALLDAPLVLELLDAQFLGFPGPGGWVNRTLGLRSPAGGSTQKQLLNCNLEEQAP